MKNSLTVHIIVLLLAAGLLAGGVWSFWWLRSQLKALSETNATLFQDVSHAHTKHLRSVSLGALARDTEDLRRRFAALFLRQEDVPTFLEALEAYDALRKTNMTITALQEKEGVVALTLEGFGPFAATVAALNRLAHLPQAAYISRYQLEYNRHSKLWQYRVHLVLLLATEQP